MLYRVKPWKTIDHEQVYCERRRYGRTTFTWLYVKRDGQFQSLGDPWPGVTPKLAEVREALKALATPTL